MAVRISNVIWNITQYPIDGGGMATIRGGIRAARFACTCGNAWEAIATDHKLSHGYFVQGLQSIIVECPKCKVREGVPDSEYACL